VVPDLPPMYEIYHYPMLFAGWFALFFTALNLLPVGQLDGGHVLYALFGRRWHGRLARGFVMMLLVSGGMGFLQSFPEFLAEQGVPPATTLPLAAFLLSLILYVYLYRIFRGVQRRMVPALVGVMGAVGGAMLVGEAATRYGYTGWLVWTALIVFLIRVDHPPVEQPQPLTRGRRALAYLAIVIFFLCFSIRPLMVVG
jgi:membrane-associated protease RseP (regulator of RpoE activity)